jgi:tetratricopeptide (TPR) repeat protein
MENRESITGSHTTFADKLSAWFVVALVFLMPIFFIPSQFVPFQFTKVILMYGLVIASFIAWIIGRLKDGKLSLSRHSLFIALGAIVVTYLAAALFSPARTVSLIGQGFEISTFAFVAAMALFIFLVSNLFVDRQRTAYAYTAFILSFIVVVLYQLLRLLVGPNFLSFGVFTSATDNLIGSWNDLGLYFGATALFSFITLELLSMPRWARTACAVMLGVSLFFLTVISFRYVWFVLGAFALIFFIYNFSFNRARLTHEGGSHEGENKRAVPVISLVVLIISFIFILFQGNIYSTLSDGLGIKPLSRFAVSNIEVSPSWVSTYQIAKNSVIRHPILGVGPNRFVTEWLNSKPVEVNNTIFWSTDFNYGIGLIPTIIVTTGIVGFLAWLAFMVLFVYTGFKALFNRTHETFTSYISISSFIISLYFWIFAIFHVPSASLMVLTFLFTGIFLASSISSGLIGLRTYDIVRDPRRSFVSVLVLIGILLGVVVFGYDITRRYIASVYFNRALVAANSSANVENAELNLGRALTFSQDDQYYRTLSQLNLIKINMLLQQQNISQDILKNQFQANLATAQGAAQAALALDPSKYENWVSAGNVYEAVVPYNFDNAYEQAIAAYTEARKRNPKSPAIPLIMARLEAAHKNMTQAKAYIAEAIQLKSDYAEAIYMLAQIQIDEGDLKSAIKSVEALTYTQPNDSGVYFQLGLLRYNDKDYAGAASALEQAIYLTPDYANAKYFLGLAYAELNKDTEAIAMFQDIKKTNPENTEVDTIISNIQAGRTPLAGLQTSNDTTTPPVQETKEDATKPDTADR